MFTFSYAFGSFFQASAKTYASNIIPDDSYLSLVATIASFCRMLGFMWSIIMEKFNFRFAYFLVLAIQIGNAMVTPIVMRQEDESGFIMKKDWYMYANIASAIAQTSHTIFFPVILAKLYGTKGGLLAYTVGFTF